MLETLHKIGEQLLEGQGIWARLTTEPKYDDNKKYYICPILFDCVDSEIKVLKDDIVLFKPDESAVKFRYVKATRKGPGQTKFDLTVERDNLKNLKESIFGKPKKQSSILSLIDSDFKHLSGSCFYRIIQEINERNFDTSILDNKIIKSLLGDLYKDIILFVSYVRSKELKAIQPVSYFDEFEEVTKGVFYRENRHEGLSHVTGEKKSEVVRAQFWSRYNIHKVFQTESLNYASEFSKENFHKYYQGTDDDFDYLDRASRYILEKHIVSIANVPHIIVPNFLSKDLSEFDLEETNLFLNKSKELLFEVNSLNEQINRELSYKKVFWINYIAYDAGGGNSFKVINQIKDVNNLYLNTAIEAFYKSGIYFQKYIGEQSTFNLKSVYHMIPTKENSKQTNLNPALLLFKDVLEQTAIRIDRLYQHFIKLIICYKNGQFESNSQRRSGFLKHKGFPNISIPEKLKDNRTKIFDDGAKKSVFKYLALFQALETLNILIMDENTANLKRQEILALYPNDDIEEFLSLKECNRNQTALFCLGRALNKIGYAQQRKSHPSKPILKKVNFNGMDLSDSKKLFKELLEKGFQYQTVKAQSGNIVKVRVQVELWLDLFCKYVDEDNWRLSNDETVFYLLAGYVFKPSTQYSDGTEDESAETN